ncbi:MAG: family 43 glycosylhydrolase [Clostridia bacterium]|nr:family 43 glycosylhydrolase [Clostridia bacterium]
MYPNPFIIQRADPFITKGNDGFYYFTASYPAFYSVDEGYDRIILRRSKTVGGLSSAEEHTIWKAHEKGVMSKHIWAPEIHFIGGRWYVFFAAGEKENIWNIRPFVLRCKGSDPISDPWEEMGKMQASEGDNSSFSSFSLDMTYFEHNGKHYVIWAEIVGNSSLFMAEIDSSEPWKLVSKPILLSKPEYDWEKVVHKVNEGASVLKTDEKIYVFFSASGTGAEYCMGVLRAESNSDLMNSASWKKSELPVLETKDLPGEAGPGHNSFVTDEEGKLLLVYHSRPESHLEKKCGTFFEESLYDPCRHARIREVYFDENNVPKLK